MLEAISLSALADVTGGSKWSDIRAAAEPHCPQTVARFPNAPSNRAQAQRIGNACLAEMGEWKASLGGRAKIQAGIDEAFPK